MSKEGSEYFKKRIAIWNEIDNPFRQFLSRIADKWSLMVIFVLSKRTKHRCRFSELKRDIPGISQRMLTATLRHLEQDGLVTRYVYPEIPPRVEYELTAWGDSVTVPIKALFDWLRENSLAVQKFREKHGMKGKFD